MENNEQEEPWVLPDHRCDGGEWVDGGWHTHKEVTEEKYGKTSKLEKYRLFKKHIGKAKDKGLRKLLKFLNSKALKLARRSYGFHVQTNLSGKIVNGQGKKPKRGDIKYYYHFCEVAIHRGKPFLIKAYECISNEMLQQIKVEISYLSPQKGRKCKSRKVRGISGRTLEKKVRAMEEIQKKFDRRFPGGEYQEFLDHSHYSR